MNVTTRRDTVTYASATIRYFQLGIYLFNSSGRMSAEKLRDEVSEHFGEMVSGDDTLLDGCGYLVTGRTQLTRRPGMSLCRTFNVPAESLLYKWQAICYNSQRSMDIFTQQSVSELRARLQSEQTKENAIRQEAMSRNSGRGRGRGHDKLSSMITKSFDQGLSVGSLKSHVVKTNPIDVAGPSRVHFQGPAADRTSKGCESAALNWLERSRMNP